ncbi:MAG: magnesium/cobalt transporter CorA [Burkholderiaceae bacterium]
MTREGARKRRTPSLSRLATRAGAGRAPGTVVASPDASQSTIRIIRYDAERFEEIQIERLDDKALERHPGQVLWVDMTGLGDIDGIEMLGRAFGLHRLALEDVVNVHQRPKTEDFGDYLFIVARMLLRDRHDSEQLALFLGDGFLLTFQQRHGDCFEPVRERLRHNKGRIRAAGADYLAYTLIDKLIDEYYPLLEGYGERLEALEDELIERPHGRQVDMLHAMKRELMGIRRVIWPMREMVNSLVRDESALVGAPARLYLRDCYDHTIQLMDIVETYRETASSLLDVYLSSMSTRMNEIMKVLTIISTIFIPLSFITGLYGMNFDRQASPWNMPELGWVFGYPMALTLMVVLGASLLFWFRHRGWIGRRDR